MIVGSMGRQVRSAPWTEGKQAERDPELIHVIDIGSDALIWRPTL